MSSGAAGGRAKEAGGRRQEEEEEEEEEEMACAAANKRNEALQERGDWRHGGRALSGLTPFCSFPLSHSLSLLSGP